MGLEIDGYVLRPARSAPANAITTGEAVTGVDRTHVDFEMPSNYGYYLSVAQRPVAPFADQYRSAVLLRPEAGKEEFLVWAANTSNFSVLAEDTEFGLWDVLGDPDFVTASAGSLEATNLIEPLEPYADGTDKLIVADEYQRSLYEVDAVVIRRGDLPLVPYGIGDKAVLFNPDGVNFSGGIAEQNPVTGAITLSDAAGNILEALGGGFSVARGDTVTFVAYRLAPPTFWWTKNEPNLTRFGWNGKVSRWEPLKGSLPQHLGKVKEDETYQLFPRPVRFEAGSELPHIVGLADSYALVRVGLAFDAGSDNPTVAVVADAAIETGPDWVTLGTDAAVGQKNGVLIFSPDYIETYGGLDVWYSPEDFTPSNDGDLGALREAATSDIALSPIPGPTDRPLLRLGFRQHLEPIMRLDDSGLNVAGAISSGYFEWSMTTGKVVFSQVDIDKATPGEGGYELSYLGARVYYDGIAMSMQPVPLKAPVACQNLGGTEMTGETPVEGIPSDGPLFLPLADPFPFPGTSGVRWVPDETGTIPKIHPLVPAPDTRPNESGLMREVEGIGDSFFFCGKQAWEFTKVMEYWSDLTPLHIAVPFLRAEVSRQRASPSPASNTMSKVQIKRAMFVGEPFYFVQAEILPAIYSDEKSGARLWSRVREPFIFADGDEKMRFSLNNTTEVIWDNADAGYGLGAGEFSAELVVASLEAAILAAGASGTHFEVTAFRGRVSIEGKGTSATDPSVEISWLDTKVHVGDLRGNAALGFLPAWRVDFTKDQVWQPDNGMAFGLHRSPENFARKNSRPDTRAVHRFGGKTGKILTKNLPATPFYNIMNHPLVDLPGFDEDVHFQRTEGLFVRELKNYDGIYYEFADDRVQWVDVAETSSDRILSPTNQLSLAALYALPDTLSSAAMEPIDSGYGLYLKEPAGIYTEQVWKEDFLLPGEGSAGQALLIDVIGVQIVEGGAGKFVAGTTTFEDNNISDWSDLVQVPEGPPEAGYLLHVLNGDAEGIYTVVSVGTGASANKLLISPAFPAAAGPDEGEAYVQWKLYHGYTREVYDPAVVADVVLDVFNHLPEEPFEIKVLTSMGTIEHPLGYTAEIGKARENDRLIWLRFGLEGGEVVPRYLETGEEIGPIAESGLVIPDLTDPFFINEDFAIRVEGRKFTTDFPASGDGLLVVTPAALITPIPGDGVFVCGATGTDPGIIQFGEDTLSENDGAMIYYDQVLPAVAPAGEAFIDPTTGDAVISANAATEFQGEELYFVEQMITENRLDVRLSPIGGSLFFQAPLREYQIVESHYFQADTDGDKLVETDDDGVDSFVEVTEFLPLYVQLEEATRVDDNTFTFNPTGRTIAEETEPMIWAGVELQNYRGFVTATVSGSTITFEEAVDEDDVVKINYGVYEAFGGEMAYEVSKKPVYRPPFMIDSGVSDFTLVGDRTDVLQVGQLFVLAEQPFYIQDVSYSHSTEETTVTIWPPTVTKVGTRSPGNDGGVLITIDPVAVVIDPAGGAISGGGYEGFMMTLLLPDGVTEVPYLEVDKFATEIIFQGDWREYMRAGHLLEVGGYPIILISSTLSEDGRYTIASFGTPIPKKMVYGTDGVRISVRPVYGPLPYQFTGVAPFIEREDYALFLLGSVDSSGQELPGKVLREGTHYMADPETGDIALMLPEQKALKGGERLLFQYIQGKVIHPIIEDEAIIAPAFKSKHLAMAIPSAENAMLGATFLAKYVFRNPDSFYAQTIPVEEYLPEVQESAVEKVQNSGPSTGGPPEAFPGDPDIQKQGILGLRGEVHDLYDLDRGGRLYLSFYNNVVVAFEQILENIDGRIIGDRDGKFKFFVGRGVRYAFRGYEDEITGFLNPRLIWRDLIETWAAGLGDGYYTEEDSLYLPPTAFPFDLTGTLYPNKTAGLPPDPFGLGFFMARQRFRVKNDMDDILMVGMKAVLSVNLFPPFPAVELKPKFEKMWEKNLFSRLYPQRTKAFTRLLPGLEANSELQIPGEYAFSRMTPQFGPLPGVVTPKITSTFATNIGPIANPALGQITGIVSVLPRNRLPRARIWAYYPEGDAKLDQAIADAGITATATVGTATLICTPLDFVDFPIDSETGFPDFMQLASLLDGGVYDLASGNLELSTPGFEAGQMVQYGQPTGDTWSLFDTSLTFPTVFGLTPPSPIPGPVFVKEVIAGAVITLGKQDGTQLIGSDIQKSDETSFEAEYGDTIFIGSKLPLDEAGGSSNDPPAMEEVALAAAALPDYRMGHDLAVGRLRGVYRDMTFPSMKDFFAFPLKEMTGQQPPAPLSCLESDVTFINTRDTPVELPCLKGEPRDDSGDVQIPFMSTTLTELSVLYEVAQSLEFFANAETPFDLLALPGIPTLVPPGLPNQYWNSIYPDEILLMDGSILAETDSGTNRDAGNLYTEHDLQPVSAMVPYVDGSLVGSLRAYDLVFVECPDDGGAGTPQDSSGLPAGSQGILTVGTVDHGDWISNGITSFAPPRFIARTRPTTPATSTEPLHKYYARNTYGFNEGWDAGTSSATRGCEFTETFGGGVWQIEFNFSSAWLHDPANRYILDDGSNTPWAAWPAGTTGGLRELMLGPWHRHFPPNHYTNAVTLTLYQPDPDHVGDPTICKLTFRSIEPPGTYSLWIPGLGAIPLFLAGLGWDIDGSFKMRFESSNSLIAATTASPAGGLSDGERYDFNINIDTYMTNETRNYISSPPAVGSNHGSHGAYVKFDRLTFEEEVSFATALPRQTRPANGWAAVDMGIQLNVIQSVVGAPGVRAATWVNHISEINGGKRLQFRERFGTPRPDILPAATLPYVGQFIGGGSGIGRIKTMPFEWDNESIVEQAGETVLDNILLSAAPSSDLGFNESPSGTGSYQLLMAHGTMWDWDHDTDPATYIGARFYITGVSGAVAPMEGAVGEVEPGDIVVVGGQYDAVTNRTYGAVKAGTYLVRHAVEPDVVDAGTPSLRGLNAKVSGGDDGWLNLTFPTVKSVNYDYDAGTFDITIDGLLPEVYGSDSGHTFEIPTPGNTRPIYFIFNTSYATQNVAQWDIEEDCVWAAMYTDITVDADGNHVFELSISDSPENAQGDVLASGSPEPAFDMLAAALAQGTRISGMTCLPIGSMGTYQDGNGVYRDLPDNNLIGANKDWMMDNCCAGFRFLTIRNNNAPADPTNTNFSNEGRLWLWDSDVAVTYNTFRESASAANYEIGVRVPTPVNPTEFQLDQKAPVYWKNRLSSIEIEGVPTFIDISHIGNDNTAPATQPPTGWDGSDQWNQINFDLRMGMSVNAAYAYDHNLTCILPGTTFWLGNNLDSTAYQDRGFSTVGGIMLEPSFPRTGVNLLSAFPHVVDADHTLEDEMVGSRNYDDFTGGGINFEQVFFYVRRIRRWHDIQDNLALDIQKLKKVYEIRRGRLPAGGYAPLTRIYTADTTVPGYDGKATNVGDFDDPDVNINPGDFLRVIDNDGTVLERVEIESVLSSNQLVIKFPGLDGGALPGSVNAGAYFEIYLQQAPVPHEQSNEQLLTYLTDEVIHERKVEYNPVNPDTDGGFVDLNNTLRDTGVSGAGAWAALGVEKDDILIIDPAGRDPLGIHNSGDPRNALYLDTERGTRPFGDRGIVERSAALPDSYEVGGPTPLDDNRGFYRIIGDEDSSVGRLEVDGTCRFAGGGEDASDSIVFGTIPEENGYVVLPTIHNSLGPPDPSLPGQEGQQMLRTTAYVDLSLPSPDDISFKDRPYDAVNLIYDRYQSIAPFGYKIIRPSPVFSDEAAELILFIRERMLSWMEEIAAWWEHYRGGSYYIFQRDEHIDDLGDPNDPEDGLGLIYNDLFIDLAGQILVQPFANVKDCLSVLDRRFWILDTRLDSEPTGGGPFPSYPFYSTLIDGEGRPVEVDLIADVLDNDDDFRGVRYAWIQFRADWGDGSIQMAQRAADRLDRKLLKEKLLVAKRKAMGKLKSS